MEGRVASAVPMQQLVLQGWKREWPVLLQCSSLYWTFGLESGQCRCNAAACTERLDLRVAGSVANRVVVTWLEEMQYWNRAKAHTARDIWQIKSIRVFLKPRNLQTILPVLAFPWAINVMFTVSRDLTSCRLVDLNGRFRITCCAYRQTLSAGMGALLKLYTSSDKFW